MTRNSERKPWKDRAFAAPPPLVRKLKLGALKLLFFEVGPFEIDLPAAVGRSNALAIASVVMAIAAAAALTTYWWVLWPALSDARDLMRRGEYVRAAERMATEPAWAADLPYIKRATAITRLARRLEEGEHVRTLGAELASLENDYPDHPDVLVMRGVQEFFVYNSADRALGYFRQAADQDSQHVEAHMQAAARLVDQAYAALASNRLDVARSLDAEARALVERAAAHAPFSATVPRYVNQIAELDELEGRPEAAYERYKSVGNLHPLSALQAAWMSWRVTHEPAVALRNSLEMLEAAVSQLQAAQGASQAEGWLFRLDGTDVVDLHPKGEKLCILQWTQHVTKSFLDGIAAGGSPVRTDEGATRPASCAGQSAAVDRVAEILCVQLFSAKAELAATDQRLPRIEHWKLNRLTCPAAVKPLPRLLPKVSA
jgi:hypothetical protein